MDNYIVYKTICLINNKYYIGVHKKGITNGRYLGSGKALRRAIKKYGRENFIRVTLFSFDNHIDAYLKEAEIVNEELIQDPMCYNIMVGGYGTGSGELSPLYGIHVPHSVKVKMSNSNKCKREVVYKGITFPSVKSASLFFNTHRSTIRNHCLSTSIEYAYYTNEDHQKEVVNTYIKKNPFEYNKCKPCSVYGLSFPSMLEASKTFKVSPSTVRNWVLDSKKTECYYIEKGYDVSDYKPTSF